MHLQPDMDMPDSPPWIEIPAFRLIAGQLDEVRRSINENLSPARPDFPLRRTTGGSRVAGESSDGLVDIRYLLDHINARSGKMLRPGMVLLAGGCCGNITDEHIHVAAIVELVHNATLLHDDVIDDGQTRRGLPTINSLWGNESAVLLGDYLLSRVFKMSADLRPDIAKSIAEIAVHVCKGELQQVLQRQNRQLTEQQYLDIITDKSAAFFSGCCRLGALMAQANENQVKALELFGLNSGIAFQITDDVLDITGDQKQTGKSPDSDAAQSKLTLPVIHLLNAIDQANRSEVLALLNAPPKSRRRLREMLTSYGSLNYAHSKAKQYVVKAIEYLNVLPQNSAREALIGVAQFITNRTK